MKRKMIIALILIFLFLLTNLTALGFKISKTRKANDLNAIIEEYKLYGYVKLKNSGEPLEDVLFRTIPKGPECYSNQDGYYELIYYAPQRRIPIFVSKGEYIIKEPGKLIENQIVLILTKDEPIRKIDLIAYKDKSKESGLSKNWTSLSGKSVSGFVYSYPSNTPLEGVKVELRGFFGGYANQVKTDSDGAFLFEDCLLAPTDIYRLEAFKQGLQCNAIGFCGNNQNHKIDLWLAPPGSGEIYGYVKDSSGNAIASAKVKLEAFLEDTRRTTTSSNGYYEFSNVDIPYVDDGNGEGYRINVSKEGFQTIKKNIVGVGEYGNFIIQKDFELLKKSKRKDEKQSNKDNYKVHGYVKFKSNNKPVEGIKVGKIGKFPGEVVSKYDFTDSNGYYCIQWEKRPFLITITCDQSSLPENYTFSPSHNNIIWGEDKEAEVNFKIISTKNKKIDKIDIENNHFLIVNNFFKLLYKILDLNIF